MRPIIKELMIGGCTGPTSLSRELNQRAVPTRAGGLWYPVTVFRLLLLLEKEVLQAEVKEERSRKLSEYMRQVYEEKS
jgi:hypothetical protein